MLPNGRLRRILILAICLYPVVYPGRFRVSWCLSLIPFVSSLDSHLNELACSNTFAILGSKWPHGVYFTDNIVINISKGQNCCKSISKLLLSITIGSHQSEATSQLIKDYATVKGAFKSRLAHTDKKLEWRIIIQSGNESCFLKSFPVIFSECLGGDGLMCYTKDRLPPHQPAILLRNHCVNLVFVYVNDLRAISSTLTLTDIVHCGINSFCRGGHSRSLHAWLQGHHGWPVHRPSFQVDHSLFLRAWPQERP